MFVENHVLLSGTPRIYILQMRIGGAKP